MKKLSRTVLVSLNEERSKLATGTHRPAGCLADDGGLKTGGKLKACRETLVTQGTETDHAVAARQRCARGGGRGGSGGLSERRGAGTFRGQRKAVRWRETKELQKSGNRMKVLLTLLTFRC